MTVVMLVTMILIVHKISDRRGISRKVKIKQHISGTNVLGKEKVRATDCKRRPSRRSVVFVRLRLTGLKLAFPCHDNVVEGVAGGTLRCLTLCSIYIWPSSLRAF
jgi:hypothetical protein